MLLVLGGAPAVAGADNAVPPQETGLAPIARLFERIHSDFPGHILTVELKASAAPPVYRVKLLTAGGDVLMLAYDAQTLQLESVVGRLASGGPEKPEQASAGQGGDDKDDDKHDGGRGGRDDDDDDGGRGGRDDDDDDD